MFFINNTGKSKTLQLSSLILFLFLLTSNSHALPETTQAQTDWTVLFQDDFEDGIADGWYLEGWQIELDNRNYVLSSSGGDYNMAMPIVSGWMDYAVEARIKVINGQILFHFRMRKDSYAYREYFLDMNNWGLILYKRIDEDETILAEIHPGIDYNVWYLVKIIVRGSNIKIYVDNALKFDYTDNNSPLLFGKFGFHTGYDFRAHVDDIVVTGEEPIQETSWLRTGGPSGGLGYDIRIHPLDKNIMFVTDNPSGVNKSFNAGTTWSTKNKGIIARGGPSGDGIPIFCLTIDPNNPNIVWAGTQYTRGIYKSTDGGATWTKKDNGIMEGNEISFRNFGINPHNSDIVFAGAEITTGIKGMEFDKAKGKIYKTKDGGENWRCVWEGDSLVRFVIIDPTDSNIVYASTGIFDREAHNDVGVGILKRLV